MFQQISILGPGLLGASLALALKGRGLCQRVHVWSRRSETRTQASLTDWCDATFNTAPEACKGSQLIAICTPVETIVPILNQILPTVDKATLITDVGSTKKIICEKAKSIDLEFNFIGSHPMAGSEKTGMLNAHADLFQDAACILTPHEDAQNMQIERLHKLWAAVGMKVAITTPQKHDEIVAHISHLPHLIATSLSSYLLLQDGGWRKLAGGGLRDTTRVASGDPNLWKQILEHNREEVLRAIDGFQSELEGFKSALLGEDRSELIARLERGKCFRDQI
ncbi:MAG: prephenate dehydrogenase/arogenate dehydrogenase family protein [Verrucomicrobiota bacterium]|nr:prephenate dehydrogenase/arogenate dehydrogenase family protein [Verrucomicrobiota bacterium]